MLGVTHSIEQMCNNMYPSLWYYTVYFHYPEIHLFHLFLCFPTPPTIDLLTISDVLPFSEYRILIVGIIRSVAISDWRLSPSSRHLRFFHVLPWLDTSVVFSSELYSFIRMFSSVQLNCSVVSYSLRPHGLQHARLPCPSPTPGAYSNSCPSSW